MKLKKIITIITALAVTAAAVPTAAAEEDMSAAEANLSKTAEAVSDVNAEEANPAKDFTYEINGKDEEAYVSIIKYLGEGGTVVIPARIEGLPVTWVEYSAFSDCTLPTTIFIPRTVDKVYHPVSSKDPYAVFNSPNLIAINADEDNPVYSSQDGVLFSKDKTTLLIYPEGKPDKTYTVPSSTTYICQNSFRDCLALKEVIIPKSVTNIDWYSFNGCTSLNAFDVDSGNTKYSSEKGILFNKDKTSLEQYPAGKSDANYNIPNGVTKIQPFAFFDASSLTTVKVPNSVTEIGSYAGMYSFNNSVTLCCYENSYAQAYAEENNIPFRIIGKTDTDSGIIIENPNLEGIILNVEKGNSSDTEMIYNITLKDANGSEIQPEGDVTVMIPLPEGWENASVSRRETDGTLTDMKTVCENGYIVFVTDHFSEYILTSSSKPAETTSAETEKPKETSANDGDNDSNMPTGFMLPIIPVIFAAAGAILTKKRK